MINIVIGVIIGIVMGYGAAVSDVNEKYTQGFADGLSEARKRDRAQTIRDNSCVLWWTTADGRTLHEAKKAICGARK